MADAGRQRFFFERKNQKAFVHLLRPLQGKGDAKRIKSFCFFFQKEALASFTFATLVA
jgi:hypothetical protein